MEYEYYTLHSASDGQIILASKGNEIRNDLTLIEYSELVNPPLAVINVLPDELIEELVRVHGVPHLKLETHLVFKMVENKLLMWRVEGSD